MKKTIFLLVGALSPLVVQAATITHHGYTLDTETNIVTGGGLEWLRWSETDGQSADTALSNYSSESWRMASHADMLALMNDFPFEWVFDSSENSGDSTSGGIHSIVRYQATLDFIELFGATKSPGSDPDIAVESSLAVFGLDDDGDGLINLAEVQAGIRTGFGFSFDGVVSLSPDGLPRDISSDWFGVALVRTAEVPIPAAGWFFVSAIAGLGLVNIKIKGCVK